MAEDHLSTWIEFQQKTWQADSGSKAKTIVVKRKNTDDVVCTFPADAENLASMIRIALQMQADELPKGSHSFTCLALDDKGAQLSELPQTVKGMSKDATNAAQEQVALQNAAAKALGNLDFANQVMSRQLAQMAEKLSAEVEDKFAVLNRLVEEQGSNFESQLALQRFLRREQRIDTLIDNLAPALGILANWAAEKVISSNPDLKGALNNVRSATAEKPSDATVPSIPESRQGPIQADASNGSKGNGRLVPT